MTKVEAILRPETLDHVKEALAAQGFIGLNVVSVSGRGIQKGITYEGRAGHRVILEMLPKIKLEIVVRDADAPKVVEIIVATARTGNIGDGKIFLSPVSEVIRVRTGERGEKAI